MAFLAHSRVLERTNSKLRPAGLELLDDKSVAIGHVPQKRKRSRSRRLSRQTHT